VTFLAIRFLHKRQTNISPNETPSPTVPTETSKPTETSIQPPPKASEEKRMKAPSLEKYKEEATRNPHEPPRSLSDYATYIGKRWEQTAGQPTEIEAFFEELSDCAIANDNYPVATPIRAFCADSAGLLADKNFELLNQSWFDLYQQLDSEVKKLIQPLRTKSEKQK